MLHHYYEMFYPTVIRDRKGFIGKRTKSKIKVKRGKSASTKSKLFFLDQTITEKRILAEKLRNMQILFLGWDILIVF